MERRTAPAGSLESHARSIAVLAAHVNSRNYGLVQMLTFVSTVGLDEQMARAYIRNQEAEDKRYDQMKLVME